MAITTHGFGWMFLTIPTQRQDYHAIFDTALSFDASSEVQAILFRILAQF